MITRFKIFFCAMLVLTACSKPTPSTKATSTSAYTQGKQQTGTASWYGGKFHGRATASGEIYDQDQLTAAHRFAPMHTMVEVTNLDNGQKVTVKINDRGPFVKGRIIDLSREAARQINMLGTGTAPVSLRFLDLSPEAKARRYYIQTGSYADPENAHMQKMSIRRAFPQLDAQVVHIKGLYKLRVGRYTSKADALADVRRLRAKNFDGIVLQFK